MNQADQGNAAAKQGLAAPELGQPFGGSGLFAGDGVLVQGASQGNPVQISGKLAKLKLSLIGVGLE